MFTCLIRYTLDPDKISEFEEYACTWISLIEKFGGIHHGYFLPACDHDLFPKADFSFSEIGKNGPNNIAVAIFSFPDLKTYENYRANVVKDESCKIATEKLKRSRCFLSYERSFLRPIFKEK